MTQEFGNLGPLLDSSQPAARLALCLLICDKGWDNKALRSSVVLILHVYDSIANGGGR